MLAAPAGYFKYQAPRWQHAPQYFKDRLAVASDVRMIQPWIGFFGHPGSQQAVSMAHDDNSSSNALAPFRSGVSNPSVNQP